ncbi:MAG TPA: 30S ribosomal protein S6 [Acidimicrobiales bacterium]|jgi:small subunit ribosomal protein S6|nr:30S ribosomal protein S6 [Actinomycetota bacterium]MDP6061937.1 30S ribosomal protein S6 [Acidimicrobiales bacterium]MDP6213406.1 30S ribosomal protein S6 [Acidimicrobiales bacterium]MDP7209583.1 30S ribosomal protein S6 [Acidimicrobiales bacterium]HJL89270.1 30S ribosomal protein S6 [Acidimicrobiales bacterium]
MRVYELMIIYNGDLDEEAVAAWQDQVTTNIEAEGGRVPTVLDTEPWGRRRFAYQIDHRWEGFYVVLEVVTEANDLASTDRILRLADRSDVVRHKIMRLPDDEAARRGLIGEAEPADVG